MNRRIGSLLAAILTVAAVPAAAQWLHLPSKGIPRTQDGNPDLSAPAPRKQDGKPDLSGIWQGEQWQKYFLNLGADLKPGELPIQPWADALTKERMTGSHDSEFPFARCLPQGIPILDRSGFPFKIMQEPDVVAILYEVFGQFRQIFLDGRTLLADPNPTWLGYSVGHWDGDTLVVDTSGFNGKTWLDVAGHPTTDALHIIEHFRRRDLGHLDIQITIDDPKAYTRPWAVMVRLQLDADTELLEYVCNENEKDVKHMVGQK